MTDKQENNMTTPPTTASALASECLPCGRKQRFGELSFNCGDGEHDPDCAASLRPTVTVAFQKLMDEKAGVVTELEALQSEITEAAYRAWPEAEDCGYDAGHIIDQLATERDQAHARIAALEAELGKAKQTLQQIADGYRETLHSSTLDRITALGIRPLWMSDVSWENRVRLKHFGAQP